MLKYWNTIHNAIVAGNDCVKKDEAADLNILKSCVDSCLKMGGLLCAGVSMFTN